MQGTKAEDNVAFKKSKPFILATGTRCKLQAELNRIEPEIAVTLPARFSAAGPVERLRPGAVLREH